MTNEKILPNQNGRIEIEAAAVKPKDEVRQAEFLIESYKKVIREIARFIAEKTESLGKVNGYRVVNSGTDALTT